MWWGRELFFAGRIFLFSFGLESLCEVRESTIVCRAPALVVATLQNPVRLAELLWIGLIFVLASIVPLGILFWFCQASCNIALVREIDSTRQPAVSHCRQTQGALSSTP